MGLRSWLTVSFLSPSFKKPCIELLLFVTSNDLLAKIKVMNQIEGLCNRMGKDEKRRLEWNGLFGERWVDMCSITCMFFLTWNWVWHFGFRVNDSFPKIEIQSWIRILKRSMDSSLNATRWSDPFLQSEANQDGLPHPPYPGAYKTKSLTDEYTNGHIILMCWPNVAAD